MSVPDRAFTHAGAFGHTGGSGTRRARTATGLLADNIGEDEPGDSETEEREITVGDVVQIKAGERHWHGAKADTTLSHITITAAGGTSKH